MPKFKEISLLRDDRPTKRLRILMKKLKIGNPEDSDLEDILAIIFNFGRKKLNDIFERTGSETITIAPNEIPAIKEQLRKMIKIATKGYENKTEYPEDDEIDWLEFEL